jgi:hypothetical protein
VRLSDVEAETREVKRDALVRALGRYAAKKNLPFELDKAGGKGSHYRLRLGDAVTTVQSGELTPLLVNRICKQLGVDPAVI